MKGGKERLNAEHGFFIFFNVSVIAYFESNGSALEGGYWRSFWYLCRKGVL